jgi:hypothetical protein
MSAHKSISVGVVSLALLLTGCGPAKPDATARKRLELEEQARREAVAGNHAITEMTEKAFRRRTPEEEAQHQAERARQVQALLDAQKQAEANAAKSPAKL